MACVYYESVKTIPPVRGIPIDPEYAREPGYGEGRDEDYNNFVYYCNKCGSWNLKVQKKKVKETITPTGLLKALKTTETRFHVRISGATCLDCETLYPMSFFKDLSNPRGYTREDITTPNHLKLSAPSPAKSPYPNYYYADAYLKDFYSEAKPQERGFFKLYAYIFIFMMVAAWILMQTSLNGTVTFIVIIFVALVFLSYLFDLL